MTRNELLRVQERKYPNSVILCSETLEQLYSIHAPDYLEFVRQIMDEYARRYGDNLVFYCLRQNAKPKPYYCLGIRFGILGREYCSLPVIQEDRLI